MAIHLECESFVLFQASSGRDRDIFNFAEYFGEGLRMYYFALQ